MAARANYIIDQGANFSSTVTVKDSQGVALNLTGYTASANMALGHASTRTRTALTIEFASDRTTGEITISLTPTQTAALEEGRYVYDVEVTKTDDSTVTRVIQGIVTVSPNATR